jgi:hypothetical protein
MSRGECRLELPGVRPQRQHSAGQNLGNRGGDLLAIDGPKDNPGW